MVVPEAMVASGMFAVRQQRAEMTLIFAPLFKYFHHGKKAWTGPPVEIEGFVFNVQDPRLALNVTELLV